jgi:hypothetical protein
MKIADYISRQPESRQSILAGIHQIITENDKNVIPEIGSMMGKEMIIYRERTQMKYGLASVKNYMSLHVMPIYGSPKLFAKYRALLPKAVFQKGCINFNNGVEMPLDIVKELIKDCAKADLLRMKETYIKTRKNKPTH